MAKAKKKKNDAEHKARIQEKVTCLDFCTLSKLHSDKTVICIQAQRKSNKKVKKSKDKAEEPEEDIESILAAFKKQVRYDELVFYDWISRRCIYLTLGVARRNVPSQRGSHWEPTEQKSQRHLLSASNQHQ